MEDKVKKIISYQVIEVCYGMDFISKANTIEQYGEELYKILGDDIFKLLKNEDLGYEDILEEVHSKSNKIEP